MKVVDVAVLGATGAVGTAMLEILAERKFPAANVFALASERSAGKRVPFGDDELIVQDVAEFDFSRVQIGLFSAGAKVSAEYAPKAAAAGCLVIDNTSQFRYQDDIPLVVAEVNPEALAQCRTHGIIANPNCSTIQMVVALKPIHDAVGITRINVATYQSVSGAGKDAMDELWNQTKGMYVRGAEVEPSKFPKQIAFNVIPHIDKFVEGGYTGEEMKLVNEVRKILELPELAVSPTTVRVPVFTAHSISVNAETERRVSAAQARAAFERFPGLRVVDDPAHNRYPMPVLAEGQDDCMVGRIREDIGYPNAINFWVVGDQLRKGAALNGIQIAELLIA